MTNVFDDPSSTRQFILTLLTLFSLLFGKKLGLELDPATMTTIAGFMGGLIGLSKVKAVAEAHIEAKTEAAKVNSMAAADAVLKPPSIPPVTP